MIVILYGEHDSSGLNMIIPSIHFDRRFSYKIGVSHLYFEISDIENPLTKDLLCLWSNTIDRSNINDKQVLLTINNNNESRTINVKPERIVFHPLHLYELYSSSFVIKSFFEEKPIPVGKIFIELEILRIDSYGRL